MTARLMLAPGSWDRSGLTYARGQGFDRTGSLLRAREIAALFDRLTDRETWASTATGINGSFAVIKADDTEVRAAVDRLRGFPLFFADTKEGLIVGDAADSIYPFLRRHKLDSISASEFRLTGYVTGADTLIEGLYQIRAGHCFFHAPGEDLLHVQQRYYEFRHRAFFPEDDEALIGLLVETHRGVFQRLLRSVGDRQVVIPLSGGYDSRLVGLMLRDLGCRNVLCYSYGIAGNWEARISRELAAYLGFRWTMIAYSGEQWRRWAATPDFRHYFREAGHLAAIPHIQDWPAVYELQRRGEVAEDAVFVPGHSGDFLAGSHIPLWFAGRARISRDELLQSIFSAHYSLWDWPRDSDDRLHSVLAQRVERICGPVTDGTPEEAADRFECWDCQERQAKFIVNSMRVYESFGFEWRLPLFDAELMDFWSRVPLQRRVGRRLYFEFSRRHQDLPITAANADRPILVAQAIRTVKRSDLWPYAKRVQRVLRRLQWRRQYDSADGMGWFALVDREQFHSLYTGREIGHSFFALKYLDAIAPPRCVRERRLTRSNNATDERVPEHDSNHSHPAGRTQFEQEWHERFVEFATLREDDAGIAGWSSSGLETRFRVFRRLWRPVAAGARYIDVGCGAATYTRWLAEQGVRIVGLDYSHPTLIKARARTPADIPLCAADASCLPFRDGTFDGALCFGLLQAVSDSDGVVRELARVLKPGGELWIDALNGAGVAARVAQARLRLRGKDMHLRYESQHRVARVLRDAGFIDLAPHWLPIVPARIQPLQPLLESRGVRYAMARISWAGALLSHSFIFHARRAGKATAS